MIPLGRRRSEFADLACILQNQLVWDFLYELACNKIQKILIVVVFCVSGRDWRSVLASDNEVKLASKSLDSSVFSR